MKKKGLPEWMNSPLWSTPTQSPPPTDYPSSSLSSKEAVDRLHGEHKQETINRTPPPTMTIQKRSPPPILTPVSPAPVAESPRQDPYPQPRFSLEEASRRAQILEELSKKIINIGELRRLTSQGILDGDGVRSTVWKSEITRRLDESSGIANDSTAAGSGSLARSEIVHGEHPLSLGKSSVWNQFFQDTEIIEQIDRDVMRTHPDMDFFCGDDSFAKSNQDALRRILIIFAKLNSGIRYVQGMNEVVAPLFCVSERSRLQ